MSKNTNITVVVEVPSENTELQMVKTYWITYLTVGVLGFLFLTLTALPNLVSMLIYSTGKRIRMPKHL